MYFEISTFKPMSYTSKAKKVKHDSAIAKALFELKKCKAQNKGKEVIMCFCVDRVSSAMAFAKKLANAGQYEAAATVLVAIEKAMKRGKK